MIRAPSGGSKAATAVFTRCFAPMSLDVACDVADGLDPTKLVRVDRDLVAIAEDRNELDHVDRVSNDFRDRSPEGGLAFLDREGFSNDLEEVVAHAVTSR